MSHTDGSFDDADSHMTTRTCRVVDISEGGAGIEISFKADVPDHFYMVLGEREYIVAAAVVGREDRMLHLQFLKLMPTRLVNRLSRITDPMRTMSARSDLLQDIQ